MRSVVIGADGFVGRWLVRHLVDQGDDVHAVSGPRHSYAAFEERVSTSSVDVRDEDALARVIAEADCDHLYYLAGVSDPGEREDIALATGVGVVGAVNAFAAMAALPKGRIRRMLHVGTAHVYGPEARSPIDESADTRPVTVYGATKLAAERGLATLAPQTEVEVVLARPFNHIGPGQRNSFVVPSLAHQVAAIAAGRSEATITLGSMDTARDFTDVRDVVRGYRLMLMYGTPGAIFNIASGRAVTTGQIAAELLELAGVNARFEVDPGAVRGGEANTLFGSYHRLQQATGWEPSIELSQTLADVLAAEAKPDVGRTA